MTTILRFVFYGILVRTFVLIVLGLNVRGRQHLPRQGPAILAANHNSHLDTLALVSLLPISQLQHIRPVAAADYFLRNRYLAWFALNIIGILPMPRRQTKGGPDVFAGCRQALEQGDILIFFPEGSRGAPETLQSFKNGLSRLAECQPNAPIIPIYTHGLGKALPKGEGLLVPFFLDIFVGESLHWNGQKKAFMESYQLSMHALQGQHTAPSWD